VTPFKHFYERQKSRLFAYLLRMTGDYDVARDLMQESFTRYLERYGQHQQIASLLFTIGRNALVDNARKQGRNTPLATEPADSGPDQEKILMVRESCRKVLEAMKKLRPQERDILALTLSSGLSYRDIASVAGISEANVKVTVHRARQKIRTILQAGDL
jgi:RNA polymerase sigma-70 factor (ECF subfamily)